MMPLLKWLRVCTLQFTKSLKTHKSPNRMHPDAKKQPVSFMEYYTHISSTFESWIIVPHRLLIFRFFSTKGIFIPTPLLLVSSHFCSHFWVWIAIFTILHHKEKEIVHSSTITMYYVNTKHMLRHMWNA